MRHGSADAPDEQDGFPITPTRWLAYKIKLWHEGIDNVHNEIPVGVHIEADLFPNAVTDAPDAEGRTDHEALLCSKCSLPHFWELETVLRLPLLARIVVLAKIWGDMTDAETAQVVRAECDSSKAPAPTTVSRALARAMAQLRPHLSKPRVQPSV